MYSLQMLRYFRGSYFRGAKLARMSDGSYCIIRDLGLVKGGKGMRHHEVLVTLSPGALLRRAIKGKGLKFSIGSLPRRVLLAWRQSSNFPEVWRARNRPQFPSPNTSGPSPRSSRTH